MLHSHFREISKEFIPESVWCVDDKGLQKCASLLM